MLTEPNAGSDLTAVRTSAVRDGDDYLISGEKLFISNLREGRIAGLQQESAESERLKEEIEALRVEREQVRLRVERLLGQLDALDF